LSFDLETIPQEPDTLTESQKKQYEKKAASMLQSPNVTENMIRSTDPFIGRILCIGMYYKNDEVDPVQEEKIAFWEGTEKDILLRFWGVIEKLQPGTKIITFNGFNFDIPWIRIRSLVHGIKLPKCPVDFFNVNPFKNTPHVDMMIAIKNDKYLKNISVGLGLACDSFGVPTPKDGIDGSQVYDAYKQGRIEEIASYVKKDVYSTGLLYERLKELNYGI
jgi:predicted PolB exonuclease-like 3'-5' exonuclease